MLLDFLVEVIDSLFNSQAFHVFKEQCVVPTVCNQLPTHVAKHSRRAKVSIFCYLRYFLSVACGRLGKPVKLCKCLKPVTWPKFKLGTIRIQRKEGHYSTACLLFGYTIQSTRKVSAGFVIGQVTDSPPKLVKFSVKPLAYFPLNKKCHSHRSVYCQL